MKPSEILQALVRPLRSRKVRVALATVLAAYAGTAGLDLPDEVIFTMLGTGVALILGIAHEDNGRKTRISIQAGPAPTQKTPPA